MNDMPKLTPQELKVLQLMAMGYTNQEIAQNLVVSDSTAKFHVGNIIAKLGANNRTHAVYIAGKIGY